LKIKIFGPQNGLPHRDLLLCTALINDACDQHTCFAPTRRSNVCIELFFFLDCFTEIFSFNNFRIEKILIKIINFDHFIKYILSIKGNKFEIQKQIKPNKQKEFPSGQPPSPAPSHSAVSSNDDDSLFEWIENVEPARLAAMAKLLDDIAPPPRKAAIVFFY
jgi:hypothetical protein